MLLWCDLISFSIEVIFCPHFNCISSLFSFFSLFFVLASTAFFLMRSSSAFSARFRFLFSDALEDLPAHEIPGPLRIQKPQKEEGGRGRARGGGGSGMTKEPYSMPKRALQYAKKSPTSPKKGPKVPQKRALHHLKRAR